MVMKLTKHYVAIFRILFTLITLGVFFIFSQKKLEEPSKELKMRKSPGIEVNSEKKEPLSLSPEAIKAIYMTSWSASREDYLNYAINVAKNTEINAVVVDVKDFSGYVAYDTKVPDAEKYNAKSTRIKDIGAFIKRFHHEGIYLIARISVFQDLVLSQARPDLAVWSRAKLLLPFFPPFSPSFLWLDNLGLAWIDPAAKEAWDYNIAISKEALDLGFDEINFDYVRFPSDGDLSDMGFPFWDGKIEKHLVITEFFKYLRKSLPDAKLSVDLFGLSTVNSDDLGVGQVIEDAFKYFDFVCPMLYPSHYAEGFLGCLKPASYPYEVIKYSMENAIKRLSVFAQSKKTRRVQLRPWLQDFNLGAIYDAKAVKSEIQAVYDATGNDFKGFMLWNPSNIYTEEALLPAVSK